MIQVGTKLNIIDNTGVKFVKCIKVLGKGQKFFAYIGDKILVSIKETYSKSKIKNGSINYAIVIRTKKEIKRNNDIIIKFFTNSAILIDKEGNPIGTRILGFIPIEIKNNYQKILSLAQEII